MTDKKDVFRIGLVMAGAVSAGAYTAGVLDFLFEALDQWEKQKKEHPDTTPNHKVVIDVMSGASAGGVCAAFSCMLPALGHFPVHSPCDRNIKKNLLYQTWVKRLDLAGLLDLEDLEGTVPALLSGAPLDKAANYALKEVIRQTTARNAKTYPAWFSDNMQVFLTLTNTRGLPYTLPMKNALGNTYDASLHPQGHQMMLHRDVACFTLGTNPPASRPEKQGYPIIYNTGDRGIWQKLAEAAKATGAFPVGLPARRFNQERWIYETQWWKDYHGFGNASSTLDKNISDFPFFVLDGGVMNNEPIDLARNHLDIEKTTDPVTADKADAAILMIDPFAENDPVPDCPETFNILDSAASLLGSMKAQCRFKAKELLLAMNPKSFDRYLIAPSRGRTPLGETQLASSGLGGFSGFLHESIREHDFFLGRRNCQHFLENHFNIDVTNSLVADSVAALQNKGVLKNHRPVFYDPVTIKDPVTQEEQVVGTVKRIDETLLRLIPLYGTAAMSPGTYNPSYPDLNFKRDIEKPLRAGLEQRSKKAVMIATDYAMKKLGIPRPIRWLGKIILPAWLDGVVRDHALKKIKEDLTNRRICK